MIVLWLLILRGVSLEFRNHIDNAEWRQFWSIVFALASTALALVFGIALGNVVRGVPLDRSGYFFLPLWTDLTPTGRVGVIDWYTLLVGIASVLTLAVHGSLWLILKTEGDLQARARRFAAGSWTGLSIAGMLSSAAFGIFPNVLPSNTMPDHSMLGTL